MHRRVETERRNLLKKDESRGRRECIRGETEGLNSNEFRDSIENRCNNDKRTL